MSGNIRMKLTPIFFCIVFYFFEHGIAIPLDLKESNITEGLTGRDAMSHDNDTRNQTANGDLIPQQMKLCSSHGECHCINSVPICYNGRCFCVYASNFADGEQPLMDDESESKPREDST